MYATTSKDEVIIRMVGKLSMELDLDHQTQLSVRSIVEEALYKYDVLPQETALVASDIEDKLQMYFAVKELEGYSKKTLNCKKYSLLIFADFMKKPLASITTTDLRMFLSVRCKGLKESTKNNQISTLKAFFAWLFDEGYIPSNPAGKLKNTKLPGRVRKPLSDTELEILRQACLTTREKSIVEFAYASGCRLSEIVGINKADICWSQRSLFVIGKGNKEREVFFNARAEVLLKAYLNSRNDDCEALFVTMRKRKGKYTRLSGRAIEKEVHKIALRTGLERSVFPHLFRHSFADHRLNAGAPIHIVQKLLGHSTPATTQTYCDASRENVVHEYRKGA